MKKLNIAFLIDTIASDKAGTQKQLLETIRRLDKERFSPSLVTLRRSEWMRENALPCPNYDLGYNGFLKPSFPGVLKRLCRYWDAERIDIAHTFFPEATLIAFFSHLFSATRPCLVSGRRDIGLGAANQPWYHTLYAMLQPIVNRRYLGIVANSRTVREYVIANERTSPDKITVIYNGVDIPERLEPEQQETKNISQTVIRIGIVASLTPVKRHDVLINAFARAVNSSPDLNLTLSVIGTGPARKSLQQQAVRLGIADSIIFTGAIADVSRHLQLLDIGVLCSDREGLSNAILEYMATGIPTIATDVGGNGELVTAETGLLIKPGDSEGLADAILELAGNPARRKRLGVNARIIATERYSWTSTMQSMEDFYWSIAHG